MKKEKWVQINKIQGFEEIKGCYWISNSDEDKIINRNTGKILRFHLDKDGYKVIGLITKNKKQKPYRIHAIKISAFIYTPNLLTYNIIRHLNDIKTDNRLENLAWGTQSDNVRDSIRNGSYNHKAVAEGSIKAIKKISKPVRCIETGEIYSSAYEAKRKLGITPSHISECCNGTRKTSKGFHWEFVNKEENENE